MATSKKNRETEVMGMMKGNMVEMPMKGMKVGPEKPPKKNFKKKVKKNG